MKKSKSLACAAAVSALVAGGMTTPAHAGLDPFLGEIMWVGFTFCPRGWAHADGQLLPISSNTALFALLGTQYGGDGRTTFALPDLRGRVPVHRGQGPGLTNRNQGQRSGTETNTLTTANLPAHSHSLNASSATGNTAAPAGNSLADGRTARVYSSTAPNVAMHADSIGNTGSGTSVNNMQPYLTLRACIATQGLFPSRS